MTIETRMEIGDRVQVCLGNNTAGIGIITAEKMGVAYTPKLRRRGRTQMFQVDNKPEWYTGFQLAYIPTKSQILKRGAALRLHNNEKYRAYQEFMEDGMDSNGDGSLD